MIGVFGGTFDPVHYGHIKPALSVKQALNLSCLLFIPNRLPPHREPPWLNVEQRLQLLKSAVENYHGVEVDERELVREGPSYMVDTLLSLKADYAEQKLCLILGMDAFIGFPRWHKWHTIMQLAHIVVTQRPGFSIDEMAEYFEPKDEQFLKQRMTQDSSTLVEEDSGKILLQSVPQLDISSTMIRQKLLAGDDVSEWLPEQICQQLRGFVNES